MGLISFEIRLDNVEQSYFAGQIVSGKVVIGLDRAKKVKGVKLKLVGMAKTHWKENSGKSTTNVSETEQYIEEKVYLFGYEEDNPEVILPQGWNEYPFYFKLPTDIPSSFESKHGYVKYYLESVISRSLKFDQKVRNLFTVNGILDLNSEREAGHGAELCQEKNLCCLCCKSGPIRFHLRLSRIGHVPGENIAFMTEFSNFSTQTVTFVTLTLVQSVTYHAKKCKRTENHTILSITGPSIERGESELWEGNILQIPSIPPTGLGGCRIIDIEYFIKMDMEIPGGFGLRGKIRVLIGTIPLRSTFEELTAVSNLAPAHQLQVPDSDSQRSMSYSHISTSLLSTFMEYPNLPPPTYEEAVQKYIQKMDDSNSDSEPPEYGNVSEENNFIPKYANYRIQHPNSAHS